ncbi:hypothetical protein TNCV_195361 [Trichonephila clavipes]|uniref:Uncharacterized protein n=1 Tax=Trichonephila clavipes TaxID=2585209 RepID=A0A8X6WI07_TRICX|nr:hypothetical protein TNCV_195361 [Trichonephila clavipes]
MLDHLEDKIRRVIADIRPQMLEKVIKNWTSRLDYIRASRGSPMPEIIFKIYDEVILPHVHLFQGLIVPNFTSMHVNVRPHRIIAVEELLERDDYTKED